MIDSKIEEIKRRYENVPELPYDAYMWHVHTKRYRDITACLVNIRADIPYLLTTITDLGRELERVTRERDEAVAFIPKIYGDEDYSACDVCKHAHDEDETHCLETCFRADLPNRAGWQWRGAQEE